MTVDMRKVQSRRVLVTDEIRQAVLAQLDNAVYYGGEQAFRFEKELATYLGAKHALTVNSGTSALLVAAVALGIGPGDEVLVAAHAYVSAGEVSAFLGATPVFCDCDHDTGLLTLETLSARATSRTKAIMLTHMYGHPVDMDPIMDFARSRSLKVIEICAHALGAEYKGRKAGTIGDVGMFSLGSKNISVCSTGGAVVTNSDELYREACAISRHGWPRKDIDESFFENVSFHESPMSGMFPLERDSVRPGLNLQLDEIPCAVGRIGLRNLDGWNARRREVAALYTACIAKSDLPVTPLVSHPWAKHAYLHYVVRSDARDALLKYLNGAGIEALVHYPQPLPAMRFYRERFPTPPEAYAVASRLAGEIITLPINPWISDEEVRHVVSRMEDFYRAR